MADKAHAPKRLRGKTRMFNVLYFDDDLSHVIAHAKDNSVSVGVVMRAIVHQAVEAGLGAINIQEGME